MVAVCATATACAAATAGRGTGTIEDMKHIVIWMQENRPFDHYCAWLGAWVH